MEMINDATFRAMTASGAVSSVRVIFTPGAGWLVELRIGSKRALVKMSKTETPRGWVSLERLVGWLVERGVRNFEVDAAGLLLRTP